MPNEFPDDLRFSLARDIIHDAARLALASFADLSSLDVEEKQNGQDVVSETDKAVERLIRARVAEAFPGDGVLGEEQGLDAGTSGFLWVVDPIDGTSCFVHGLDQWCISIAVMKGEETLLGVIFRPTTQDLFAARLGGGAFLNGRPMRVDTRAGIATGLLGVGANFRVPRRSVTDFIDVLLEAGGMFIRNGSGALMLAEVASGRLAGYYEPHINAWDCMAGLLMIREAGGWTAPFPTAGEALLRGGPVIGCAPQVRQDLTDLVGKSLERAGQNP
ncbi:inositol monophosphatase [Rhizobiaceae bacterium BDR2-2]|uniref:Inositol-1-monophosphatase n=1 Tax=Ectorhizobium quercum TaxID=2965071 RepID=A0AAE3N2V2_9HYPH|nr:inositol monophosphatase family protein [Ectorhizobium quercum]MCX8998280.1 inositol monophosphatase [Ectorhizobium quercum]